MPTPGQHGERLDDTSGTKTLEAARAHFLHVQASAEVADVDELLEKWSGAQT
ncbi:hypothetical protein ABIA35_003427 [Catenulispora sp. MAP12-49]|uniref:hypothetical protein n=1 Tax=Catenulispora sp. MAP12-49 TaxID=3156302 RepID=UPI003516156D